MIGEDSFISQTKAQERTLYRIAYSILHNNEDCLDAVQNALTNAWIHRARVDEAIWNEQRIKHSAPTEDAIPQEVACDLAKQAVTAETGLPMESLVPPPDTTTFYTRATGNPIWGFQFIANENGIEYDCGVMLDAYTGEILTIGLITGGGNE